MWSISIDVTIIQSIFVELTTMPMHLIFLRCGLGAKTPDVIIIRQSTTF